METRGFDGLHAALFTESRTRGRREQREVGNPGRDDKGRVATFRGVGDLDGQNIGAATLRRLQIPRLRSPGFPVETRGFDGLHAALFTESRTRGRREQREVGNPGRDDKGRVATFREVGDLDGQNIGAATLRRLQIPRLRSPGFPVETRGFDGLHAALFTESRTRGRREQREVGNPGRDDKGRVATFREVGDLDGQNVGAATLRRLQIPRLRSPGFPVETRGFDGLHAALFTESRTRGRREQREVGNPGRDDKGRVATFREVGDLDGQTVGAATLRRLRIPPLRSG